ncbi:MAG: hypothetical protein E7618_01140 [Ruminococcaceae bacterium]|nr:hypothetical protein [Oscillospiraceae bacterium]
MTSFKTIYHRLILPTCLYFTILCIVFSLLLTTSDTKMNLPTINFGNLMQIFSFCFLFAASNLLFRAKKLAFFAALFLHFFAFLANIGIVFFWIGKHYQTVSGAFGLLLVFGLVYIIVAAVAVTARHLILSFKKEQTEYKRQFR